MALKKLTKTNWAREYRDMLLSPPVAQNLGLTKSNWGLVVRDSLLSSSEFLEEGVTKSNWALMVRDMMLREQAEGGVISVSMTRLGGF